jgi:hypothetical protein
VTPKPSGLTCGIRHAELGVRCVRTPVHVGPCWGHWEPWAYAPGVRALMRVEWVSDTTTGAFVAPCTPGVLRLGDETRPSPEREPPHGVPLDLATPEDWPPGDDGPE